MPKPIYKAHLALLAANIIYGANFMIAKGVMPEKINPTALILLRLGFGTLLFWIVKSFFIKESIERKDMFRLALCGLFGASANQLLFFHGINLTSPIDGSIIMTASPVIILIFSAIILKEKITINKLAGIAIGGIGAVLLILYGNKSGGTSSFLGNLLIFLNASCYGLYLVLAKTLMKKYNPITIISWVFLFGFLYVLPIGFDDLTTTNFTAFNLNTYLSVGFVIIFTTFFTYLFNIYALNYVSPSVSSSYIYVQPVVSFLLVTIYAYFLLQDTYAEDISVIKIISCFMVVLGVYLVSKKPKHERFKTSL